MSPRHSKHVQGNNLKDIPGNQNGASMAGGTASQTVNSGPSNLSFYNTPSPMVAQVIA